MGRLLVAVTLAFAPALAGCVAVNGSGGMTIDPVSPTEATGIVHLKNDPGRYEDVYVKGPTGWRFKSRTYVPTDPVPTFQRDSRPRQSGP